MLNLLRLTVFREVNRQGSFSLAAEALSYSQPAVSHHIASLERELGAKLLERGSRGELHLTDAGAVTLAEAEVLLEAAASAERRVAHAVNTESDIRLGVTGGAPIVADALVRLHRARPQAEVKLFEGDRVHAVAALRARELDLGLVVDDPDDPLPPDAKFVCEALYSDPMLIVLPESHPLARCEVVDLGELAEANWIDRASDSSPWTHHPPDSSAVSSMLLSACANAGFEPHVAISARNPLTVQRLVVAGVGVALLSELALADPHPRVRIRRCTPTKTRRVLLAHVPANMSSTNLAILADALREAAAEYTASQKQRLEALLCQGAVLTG